MVFYALQNKNLDKCSKVEIWAKLVNTDHQRKHVGSEKVA